MTGLQVWLHPSSRTKSVSSFMFRALSTASSCNACSKLETRNLKLDSTSLRRPASVVRNRRHVADRPHFDSGGSQRTHRRLATRSRSAHSHVHAADTMIASHIRGVRRGLLRGKGSALTRSAEPERSRTLPRQNVSVHVGNGHDRVVEGRLHKRQPMRHVLAFLLLEGFLLAFFLRRGSSAARCCWFCHRFALRSWLLALSSKPKAKSQKPTAVFMSLPSPSSSWRPFPCVDLFWSGHSCGYAVRDPADSADDGIRDKNRFR